MIYGGISSSPEENDDNTECRSGIQCGGEDVVVLRPPRKVISTNQILENEANDSPGDIIYRGRRRKKTCASEDERKARDERVRRVGT